MAINVAQMLKEAAESSREVSFRSNYSGRCMRGESCVGLDGDFRDLHQVVSEVIKQFIDNLYDATIEAVEADNEVELEKTDTLKEEIQEAVDTLLNYKTDSMGLGSIMYWPDIDGEGMESSMVKRHGGEDEDEE